MKKQIALGVLTLAVLVLAGGQILHAQQTQNNDRAIATDRSYAFNNGYVYVVHVEKPVRYNDAANTRIGGQLVATSKDSIRHQIERDWQGKYHGLRCSYYLYVAPGIASMVYRGEVYYFDEQRWAENQVSILTNTQGNSAIYWGDLTGLVSINKLVSAEREVDLEEAGATSR